MGVLAQSPRHRPFSRQPARLTLAACLALGPAALLAAEPAAAQESEWGLGLGVASSSKPYIGMGRKTSIIPMLYLDNRYLRFSGATLEGKLGGLQLSAGNRLDFRLVGLWEEAGFKAKDSWFLDGMEQRKGGLWAGAKVEWQTSLLNVDAEWTHDVSGHSKGQRFKVDLTRSWHVGERFTLTPRVGASWLDDKYVDYYYGVRQHEARSDRPAYQGKSALVTEIGLQGIYRFNPHHSMIIDLRARSLPSEIKHSPLVDSSSDNRVFLGYLYRF